MGWKSSLFYFFKFTMNIKFNSNRGSLPEAGGGGKDELGGALVHGLAGRAPALA